MADLRLLLLGTIPGALLGVALLPLIPARALQVGLGIMLMAHMVWHLLAHPAGAPAFAPGSGAPSAERWPVSSRQ